MATFDTHDQDSWYFGPMSRIDATELLMNESELGAFLVRDSNTIIGDFVLCVREESKVGHYIINKIENNDQILYRIGDQFFADLPELLNFYKFHFLDTTPLKRPANKALSKTDGIDKIERVIAKFDFDGTDQDDLPFRRGEVLIVLSKDEEQWWTAKNSVGQIGQIPVPYVQLFEPSSNNSGSSEGNIINNPNCSNIQSSGGGVVSVNQPSKVRTFSSSQLGSSLKKSDLNRKLPALARVKQTRIPNAYDKTALKLEVGDIINVTKTNINGQWEGELRGKCGHFPFTHVEFIEENENLCGNVATLSPKISLSPQSQSQINDGSSPNDVSQIKQQNGRKEILCHNDWNERD